MPRLVLSVHALAALAGCQMAAYEPAPTSTPVAEVEEAATVLDADTLLAMAQESSDLAPEAAPALWLQAVQALLAERRFADAETTLANLTNLTNLTNITNITNRTSFAAPTHSETQADADPAFEFEVRALYTELALLRLDANGAKVQLVEMLPLTPEQDERYLVLVSRLRALDTDPIASAQALMRQAPPRRGQALAAYTDTLWRQVSRVEAGAVRELVNNSRGRERAWWRLQESLLDAFAVADQQAIWARFRSEHPQHPATTAPPAELAALGVARDHVDHLVLLVPQSGPLAAAGRAVRDGFMAAHLHAAGDLKRQITVLDTAAAPTPRVLARAEALGADVLVGPLDKRRLAELNGLPRTTPVLALNYLPDQAAAAPELLQLGLAVEDEAIAIGRRLAADGMSRLVVLHNEKPWSLRARDALLQTLASHTRMAVSENADQRPTLQQTIHAVGIGSTPNVRELTAVVGATLQVDASHARHKRLVRLLSTEVEFVARARQDVDAIVAFLDGPEARALRPALRFHFASHIPVFTTSQALRRVPRRDYRDLRGFNLSEIPWKLAASGIRNDVEAAFTGAAGPLAPFYALGVDAYRLADRLDLIVGLPQHRLLGGTGELSLQRDGRLRRDLGWQYVAGNELIPGRQPPRDSTAPEDTDDQNEGDLDTLSGAAGPTAARF